MKVVVFGATGNVGTSVVDALATDPAVTEIVGVARRVPASWRPAKTRFDSEDVRSPDVARLLRGADALILLTSGSSEDLLHAATGTDPHRTRHGLRRHR